MANIIKVNPDFYQEIKKALKFTDKQGSENFQNSIGFDIFKKRIIGTTKAHLYCSEVNIEWDFVTPPQANPIQIKRDAAEYLLRNPTDLLFLTDEGLKVGEATIKIFHYVNYEFVIPREFSAIRFKIADGMKILGDRDNMDGIIIGNLYEDNTSIGRNEIMLTKINLKEDRREEIPSILTVERIGYIETASFHKFALLMPLAPSNNTNGRELFLNNKYLVKILTTLKGRKNKTAIIGYNNPKSAILVTTE